MKYLLAITLSVVLISSCKKYDDGPFLSLHTKMHRLVNVWIIENVYETPQGGTKTDKTDEYKTYYAGYIMSIDKARHYTVDYSPYNISSYHEAGDWHFNASKTVVTFENSNGGASAIGSRWTILRLKEKELWMETTNSNNVTIEAHLIPF